MTQNRFRVHVQYRHVHLSAQDRERLFGTASLGPPKRRLEHEGQYVRSETVDVVGKHGIVENVPILAPEREETQLELSATDAFALGIDAPVRVSGDVARSASFRLRGPKGEVACKRGAIVPARHLHLDEATAKSLALAHLSVITLAPVGRPEEHIAHVVVRVHPQFENVFHLTVDEAAALWLQTGDEVAMI